MTEKHIPRLEHDKPSHEKQANNEHHERIQKHAAEQAERARQEKSAENLAAIKELAKAEAVESHKTKHEESTEPDTDNLLGMQSSLKATAYTRTLARIQQKLPKTERAFSRVAHNSVVDKVSAVSTQTVARPSGLLGGSICAFLGSLIFLYYSKHYGFKYNYLMLILFFAGGYLIGGLIEFVVWLAYMRRKQNY